MVTFLSSYDSLVPKRYVIVFLLSMGMCLIHAQRVTLGVTMASILTEEALPREQQNPDMPEVNWRPNQIGFLHAMFFVGYTITQLPSGYLATRFPAHRLFGISVILSASVNMLMPISIAHGGFVVTCLTRFAQGSCEGLLFPGSYGVLFQWAIPSERSRMGAILLAGAYFGAVLGLPLTGAATNYVRWDCPYYLFGVLGVVWMVIWMNLSYESPAVHPTITLDEIAYIQKEQKDTNIMYQDRPIPWVAIVTSLPVFAINVCHFARSFVFFLLTTNGPVYLNVFNITIAMNASLSALPHLGQAIVGLCSGLLADYLISNSYFTMTHTRKLFTCIGFGAGSFCFVLLFILKSGIPCITILTIGVTFGGLAVSGWNINHLDIAPQYASVLIALSTSCGNVAGIIVPIVIGHMTPKQVISEWQNVFLLTAGVLAFAVLIYGIFGSGQLQQWAKSSPPAVELLLKTHQPSSSDICYTMRQT